MRTSASRSASERAFTVLETLLSVILFSSVVLGVMELFMALTRRITEVSQVQRDSRGPQYVVSSFGSALMRSSRCALYPDRSVFLRYPALSGVAGNFAVLWFEDGSVLAFELAKSELRILENPGTGRLRERVFATGVEAPQGLCSFSKGLTKISFSAGVGAAQTQFGVCVRTGFAQ